MSRVSVRNPLRGPVPVRVLVHEPPCIHVHVLFVVSDVLIRVPVRVSVPVRSLSCPSLCLAFRVLKIFKTDSDPYPGYPDSDPTHPRDG